MRLLGIISGLFYKKILDTKKRIECKQVTFIQMLLRPENIKKQTSNFHP